MDRLEVVYKVSISKDGTYFGESLEVRYAPDGLGFQTGHQIERVEREANALRDGVREHITDEWCRQNIVEHYREKMRISNEQLRRITELIQDDVRHKQAVAFLRVVNKPSYDMLTKHQATGLIAIMEVRE